MELEIEGLKELRVALTKTTATTKAGVMEGLQKVGLEIIAEAKDNLRNNHSVVSGNLRASGKVQKDKDGVDAGFFAKGSTNGYAYFVEYGRRKGGMPYPPDLVEWLRKKNLKNKALTSAVNIVNAKRRKRQNEYTQGDLLLSAAWALAKHIAKKGTKPHPFFTPAVKKFEEKVSDIVSESVNKALK